MPNKGSAILNPCQSWTKMEESRLWSSYLGWVHCKSLNLLQPSLMHMRSNLLLKSQIFTNFLTDGNKSCNPRLFYIWLVQRGVVNIRNSLPFFEKNIQWTSGADQFGFIRSSYYEYCVLNKYTINFYSLPKTSTYLWNAKLKIDVNCRS